MLAMARHAWIRTRVMLTSPGDVALLLVAAWSGLFVWPMVVFWTRWHSHILQLLPPASLILWLWSWVAAQPFARIALSGGRSSWGRAQPLPALPIAPSARVLSEASALLALLLLIQAATVESLAKLFLVRNAYGFYDPREATWICDVARFVANASPMATADGCLLVLPLLLAWMAPARDDGAFFGRTFFVAVAGVCLPALTLTAAAANLAIALTIGLVPLLLSAYALRGGSQVPFVFGLRLVPVRPIRLSRPGLLPEARFRRDRLERLLGPLLARVAPAIAVLLGAFFLHELAGVPAIVYAVSLPVAAVLLVGLYASPIGINVFTTDRAAGSASGLGGGHGRAWSTFPLRPETVARTVYAHGLMSAFLAWLILAGLARLASRLVASKLDLPLLLLGLPCAAGLLLCAHVGDYWRGMLSATTLMSFLPAHLLMLGLLNKEILLGGAKGVPSSAVLLTLAMAGGLPPLVHLRRPRPTG